MPVRGSSAALLAGKDRYPIRHGGRATLFLKPERRGKIVVEKSRRTCRRLQIEYHAPSSTVSE